MGPTGGINWGGTAALLVCAAVCLIMAARVARSPRRLPGGWSHLTGDRAAMAARFLVRALIGLACAAVLASVAIQVLPWRLAALVLGAGVAAGVLGVARGVARFGGDS